MDTLTRHRGGLDAVARALLEQEAIDGEEVGRLVDEAFGRPVHLNGVKAVPHFNGNGHTNGRNGSTPVAAGTPAGAGGPAEAVQSGQPHPSQAHPGQAQASQAESGQPHPSQQAHPGQQAQSGQPHPAPQAPQDPATNGPHHETGGWPPPQWPPPNPHPGNHPAPAPWPPPWPADPPPQGNQGPTK